MAWYLVCLISIVAVSQVGPTELPHAGTYLQKTLEVLRPCDDFPNGDIKFSNISIEQIGRNKILVNGQLDVKIPIDEKFHLKVTKKLCKSKSERGNCEELGLDVITGMCEKLALKNETWLWFVHDLENFTPKCPVPPGSYAFHHHEVELEQVPPIAGYWIIKTEGFVGKDRVMCELQEMTYVRKKNKSGKRKSSK